MIGRNMDDKQKDALRQMAQSVLDGCDSLDPNKVPDDLTALVSVSHALATAVIEALGKPGMSEVKSALGEVGKENPNLHGIRVPVGERLKK